LNRGLVLLIGDLGLVARERIGDAEPGALQRRAAAAVPIMSWERGIASHHGEHRYRRNLFRCNAELHHKEKKFADSKSRYFADGKISDGRGNGDLALQRPGFRITDQRSP